MPASWSTALSAPARAYAPERIWQARRAFFESGAAPVGQIDELVLRSWQRCVEQGRQASESVAFDPVARTDLSRLLAQHHRLLEAARPVLASLAEAVAEAGYAVLLTDASGRALAVDGGLDRRSLPLRQAFRPGVDLSEAVIGTNAMSAAMAEQQAVQVLGPEHYFSDNQIFHCCAAPVFDPHGRIVGAVDVSRDMPGLGGGVLALTQHSARQIEQALFADWPAHLRLRLDLPGRPEAAWLGFDEDARLTAATPTAMQLFEAPGAPGGKGGGWGRHFTELFETRFDEAVHAARRGQSLRVRLHGGVGLPARAQVTATATSQRAGPPRSASVTVTVARRPRACFGDLAFEARLDRAVRAHDAALPVLITGATGAGKEVAARALHEAGRHHRGPFVALNCGAIAPQLMAAELFGHVEGAFTGARRGGSPGKVEAAQGGTLLLDEIGDMPLELQVGLLRLLDSGELVRVGCTEVRQTDVRFVCATHRDLRQRVAEGLFREDLYYRISAFTLHVPALRDRPDFDAVLDALLAREACRPERVPPSVRAQLRAQPWPGNVRQLAHALRVALAVAEPDQPLSWDDLSQGAGEGHPVDPLPATVTAAAAPAQAGPRPRAWRQVQDQAIDEALACCGGQVSEAARMLGIGRATLYRRLATRKLVASRQAS